FFCLCVCVFVCFFLNTGNVDERVSDRVLYDILIQAGRVVDLYIPRDKETERPKGYAFAEYETEETADYAVRLFSGLVTLYSRTLKFAISGQDKPGLNTPTTDTPPLNLNFKARAHPVPFNMEVSPYPTSLSTSCRISEHQSSYAPAPDGRNNLSFIQCQFPLVYYTNLMGIDHTMAATIMITAEEFLGQHWVVSHAVGRAVMILVTLIDHLETSDN
ncbi:hypothetical protein RJ639_012773, partial [Escallonia herrerae]